MRHTRRLIIAVTALFVALGMATTAAASGVTTSHSDVAFFADPATPVGSSTLVRTDNGVRADFRTSGLAPGHTLTMWWVIFNNPTGCTDPCGEDDLFEDGDPAKGLNLDGIAAADIVVGYAAGTVVNAQGKAVMSAQLSEGGALREVLFGTLPALKDSSAAEIHLVARSHGPGVPGLIDDQIGSFSGGCVDFLNPPSIPDEVGECADVQFAVHQP